MDILKIYWRVIGCQNCQKVQKFARLCKNHNFQVAVSQKKFILEGWFTIVFRVCMDCSQKHEIKCLASIICISLGAESRINFKKSEIVG